MTEEDILFLKQLKEDMLNGNNCSQAHPRFWMIMDYEERTVPSDYSEEIKIVGDGDTFSLNEFKEYLIENYAEEVDDEEKEYFVDRVKYDCADLDDFKNVMLDFSLDELDGFEEVGVKKCRFISNQTGAFLTKEDAEKHLKANDYHYNEQAHTYALTAWRNPRFEKLLDIILNTDWDKVGVSNA